MRWSLLTFILYSGYLSFILHESIFKQGGLQHVVFIWPVTWQYCYTSELVDTSVMYIKFSSSSFAVATWTHKIVRFYFISCCFESKGLPPCCHLSVEVWVELAHASCMKLVDDKVVELNDSCFGSKQLSLLLVLGFLGSNSSCRPHHGMESQFRWLEWIFSCSRGLSWITCFAIQSISENTKTSAEQTFTILPSLSRWRSLILSSSSLGEHRKNDISWCCTKDLHTIHFTRGK